MRTRAIRHLRRQRGAVAKADLRDPEVDEVELKPPPRQRHPGRRDEFSLAGSEPFPGLLTRLAIGLLPWLVGLMLLANIVTLWTGWGENSTAGFKAAIQLALSLGLLFAAITLYWIRPLQRQAHRMEYLADNFKREKDRAEDNLRNAQAELVRAHHQLQEEAAIRLKAEEATRTLSVHFDERLAERTQQLNAAIRGLQAQLAERGATSEPSPLYDQQQARLRRQLRAELSSQLVGGLAHELNNNLAPILLSAEMLRTKTLHPDDLALVTSIEGCAERCADLLKQALIFARGVEGARVPVDARTIIKEIVDIAREMFPRSIQVFSECAPDLQSVLGDAAQLHQVILKLCVNARDAMPEGGTLNVRARNLQVEGKQPLSPLELKAGNYVVIEVQDTGTPIPAEILDRIFEPSAPDQGRVWSSGWGLATAFGIVRSHGGVIEAQSTSSGRVFAVYLPAALPPVSPQPSPNVPRGHGERILVVDDDANLREVAETTLTRNGYEVLTAADGIEALGILAQYQAKTNLVLTNISMPGMDGPSLARAARKIDPQVRIIAASALGRSSGQADKLAALQSLGITHLLSKPYTAEELLETIREALSPASTQDT